VPSLVLTLSQGISLGARRRCPSELNTWLCALWRAEAGPCACEDAAVQYRGMWGCTRLVLLRGGGVGLPVWRDPLSAPRLLLSVREASQQPI